MHLGERRKFLNYATIPNNLRVVRLMRRGHRGRRFALHHLRKKIPRRRTLSRRATIRTARHTSRLLSSEMKQDIFTKSTLVHLQLGGGLIPLRALCGKDALRGRTSGEGFFPRLETLVSKSSEAVLFLPWGEGISDSSPRLSSFAETLIPPVWMSNA